MRRSALTLLMLLVPGISSASDEALETSPCPGLVSSYDTEMFERVLVVTDAEFASIEDCEQLGRFYFDPLVSSRYTLNFAHIGTIVDEIWQPVNEEAPFLVIEAILSWLKGLGFDQHADSLKHFVDRYLPAGESVRLFFTIVIWLIVIGTVALVVHEFYRAGMIRLPRRRGRHDAPKGPVSEPGRQWQEVLVLPLREQIAALLQFSLEHLAAAKLLPTSQSYTNRELVARLATTDADKASLLREQIELTEPVIYGDEPATETQVMACREKCRELGGA